MNEAVKRWAMSFHQALLGPTEAYWLDDSSDLTCKNSTRQYAVDDPLLSCKQVPAIASRGCARRGGPGREAVGRRVGAQSGSTRRPS
jgi:hypothetical protein